MNIVYSSSDLYAEIAGTSIVSLYESNKDVEKIDLYIIDNGIAETNKNNLLKIAAQYDRTIVFLSNVDLEKMAGTKINVGRWHLSTFYRLFLCSILPAAVDRVMYIDCDMIILDSLKDVWEMDMHGNYAMGADDCRSGNYRVNIGLVPEHIYINNGFLLIDLKSWRENNIEAKYLEFINRYKGDVTYVDQGVLNGVLGAMNKVGLLPLKYNVQTAFYDFNFEQIKKYRRPVFAYSKEEYEEAIKDPIIVHFTSCFISGTRPWNKKNNHVFREEFLHYRDMTSWKNAPLWDDDRKFTKKAMTVICNTMPLPLVLTLISVVHSKLYPMVRNMKMGHQEKNP
jgi:lipopolysaccharide biosynthesis glycosyltransferase